MRINKIKKVLFLVIFAVLVLLNYPTSIIFAEGNKDKKAAELTLPSQEPSASEGLIPAVEYFIAYGDTLEIYVWNNPALTREVTVGPDGQISHPLVGMIQAAGLTISQLEKMINEKLTEQEKVINSGDKIDVFVWQNPDLSKEVAVGVDGQISLPLAGRIDAAGLTVSQLEGRIKDRFSEYIKFPQVSLTLEKSTGRVSIMVKQFSSNKIIILGEVKNPGVYTYAGIIDLVEAIALAKDFTEQARKDSIMIVRGNLTEHPEVMRINMLILLSEGTSKTDIVLMPNDVIYVPKSFIANFNKFISNLTPSIQAARDLRYISDTSE